MSAAAATAKAVGKRKNRKNKAQQAHGGGQVVAAEEMPAAPWTGEEEDSGAEQADSDNEDYSDTNEERAKEYRRGGYHPVTVGELYNGRYRIVHKLGWGYFSTVWLAWDYDKAFPDQCPRLDKRCVSDPATLQLYTGDARVKDNLNEPALKKIVSPTSLLSDSSTPGEGFEVTPDGAAADGPVVVQPYGGRTRGGWAAVKFQKSAKRYSDAARDEIRLLSQLSLTALQTHNDASPSKSDRFSMAPCCRLYDHFTHSGPNGLHYCMVFDVLGENLLQPIIGTKYRGLASAWDDGVAVVKRMSAQLLRALDHAHRVAGVLHTDVKPENILFVAPPPKVQKVIREYDPPNDRGLGKLLVDKDPTTLSKSQLKRLKQRVKDGKIGADVLEKIKAERSKAFSGRGVANDEKEKDEDGAASKEKEGGKGDEVLNDVEGERLKKEDGERNVKEGAGGADASEKKPSAAVAADSDDDADGAKGDGKDGKENTKDKDNNSGSGSGSSEKAGQVTRPKTPEELLAACYTVSRGEAVDELGEDQYTLGKRPAHVVNGAVAVADFGNACWLNLQYTEEVQTRQYRSPEVIIGAGYGTAIDVWSVACVIFELLTGEFLFEPKGPPDGSDAYTRDDDHLALIMELVGPFPPHMSMHRQHPHPPTPLAYWMRDANIKEGPYPHQPPQGPDCIAEADSRVPPSDLLPPQPTDAPLLGASPHGFFYPKDRQKYFDHRGNLLMIKGLKSWSLFNVLTDKYGFSSVAAREITSFLVPMLHPDPRCRPSAAQMLRHPWLTVRPCDVDGSAKREPRRRGDPPTQLPPLDAVPWWANEDWTLSAQLALNQPHAGSLTPSMSPPPVMMPFDLDIAANDPTWCAAFFEAIMNTATVLRVKVPAAPDQATGVYGPRKVRMYADVYGVDPEKIPMPLPPGQYWAQAHGSPYSQMDPYGGGMRGADGHPAFYYGDEDDVDEPLDEEDEEDVVADVEAHAREEGADDDYDSPPPLE